MMSVEGNKMNYNSSKSPNRAQTTIEWKRKVKTFYSPKHSTSIGNLNKDFDLLKVKNSESNNADVVSIPHIESFDGHARSSGQLINSAGEFKFHGISLLIQLLDIASSIA